MKKLVYIVLLLPFFARAQSVNIGQYVTPTGNNTMTQPINLSTQASSPSAPQGGLLLYADSNTRLSWIKSDGHIRTLRFAYSGNQIISTEGKATYTLADSADVAALSASAVTASNSVTFTNKSGNISQWNNNSGYLTSITSSNVTTALGFTPYNATNPSGYGTGTVTSITPAFGFTTSSAITTSGSIKVDSTVFATKNLLSTYLTKANIVSTYAPLSSPSFITPTLGAATATTINKITITAPASSGTLTVANGTTISNLASFAFDGSGSVALVSGTKAVTITGVTSSSIPVVTLNTHGGTVTTTAMYKAACTTNTVTITAITTANATNTSDTSTINYIVVN